MKLNTFLLEDYYEKYEFKTKYMLSSSDPESWSLHEILEMATPDERAMWESQRFGYTQVKGLPALRDTIANTLYPSLTADNVLCFAGAEEGIFCTLLTLCTPQDHVIVITPCYQSLSEMPKFIGCSVTTVELKEENNWTLDIHEIEKAIRPTTKVVVINFPHNPTGQILSQQKLLELIQILDKRDIWLFSDEVYYLLGPNHTEHALPAAPLYKKAVSLGVLSKAYGLPGLRIGWIACQDQTLIQAVARTKQYTTLCNSGPSEILGLIALRNQDIILKRNNDIVAHNIALLDTFFKKYSHLFSWIRPRGGCTGFVKYHSNEPIDTFCNRVMNQAGILLLPGTVYGITSNHFRIGFGRTNMPEALTAFEQFLINEHRNT